MKVRKNAPREDLMAVGVGRSLGDHIYDVVSTFLIILVLLIVLYPIYFVVIASISDPNAVANGRVILWPKGVSFAGYLRIFQDKRIITGYANSLYYTVAGTALSTLITIMAGYSLSRKDLVGGKVIMYLYLFTMYFSAGLIPVYLMVKTLHLINTRAVIILLSCVSVYNIIIARTFFQNSLPYELLEASMLDGCGNIRFLFGIAVPLSKAIIAVIALYNAVAYWNSYFTAMIYLSDQSKYPLQMFLKEILISSRMISADVDDPSELAELQRLASTIKYGVIMVGSLPMLILYPFIQRYFVKGVMIGGIKG